MKVECPDCGKQVPTTSHPLFYCEKPSKKATVQHVPIHPELPAPSRAILPVTGTVTPEVGTVTRTVHHPSSTVHHEDGTVTVAAARTVTEVRLPKNRKWEAANSDRNRAWRREYDRKRRRRAE